MNEGQKTKLIESLAFELYCAQTRAEGLTPRAWDFVCKKQFMEAHIARAAAVRVVELLERGGDKVPGLDIATGLAILERGMQ